MRTLELSHDSCPNQGVGVTKNSTTLTLNPKQVGRRMVPVVIAVCGPESVFFLRPGCRVRVGGFFFHIGLRIQGLGFRACALFFYLFFVFSPCNPILSVIGKHVKHGCPENAGKHCHLQCF